MRPAAWLLVLVLWGVIARAETFDEQAEEVERLAGAGQYAEAEAAAERFIEASIRLNGEEHMHTVMTLMLLAKLRGDQKQFAAAEPLCERAVQIVEKKLGPDSAFAARAIMMRSAMQLGQEKFDAAESGLARALTIFEKTSGPDHPDTVALRNQLTRLRRERPPAAAAGGEPKPAIEEAPRSLVEYRDRVGETLVFKVTGASSGGGVWGSNPYTGDSMLARAAVHAGALRAGETGEISVTILPGEKSYAGSKRNGVSTGAWGGFEPAYRVNVRRGE